MPIPLPPKARAKAARKRDAITTIDWLGLWALSLGFCAIVLAGIADFMEGDYIGAAFILMGAAAIIACSFAWAQNQTSRPSAQAKTNMARNQEGKARYQQNPTIFTGPASNRIRSAVFRPAADIS